MERLEEDKLNLRKQLLSHAITKRSPAHHLDHADTGLSSHTHSLMEGESRLRELERAWQEERRGRESWQSDAELLKGRLTQTQEKVYIYDCACDIRKYVVRTCMCLPGSRDTVSWKTSWKASPEL